MRERTGSRRALECPAIGLRWPAVPQVDVISTSAREARRLPYSTKRTAVQVTFDNFGRAIQDVYATTIDKTSDSLRWVPSSSPWPRSGRLAGRTLSAGGRPLHAGRFGAVL